MGDLVALKRTVLDFHSQHSSMGEMIMEILPRLFMLARVLLTSNHADYGPDRLLSAKDFPLKQ
jgi:hypothetical protein